MHLSEELVILYSIIAVALILLVFSFLSFAFRRSPSVSQPQDKRRPKEKRKEKGKKEKKKEKRSEKEKEKERKKDKKKKEHRSQSQNIVTVCNAEITSTQGHLRQTQSSQIWREAGIYERNYHPQDLPARQITHLLYAFVNLGADGTVFRESLRRWLYGTSPVEESFPWLTSVVLAEAEAGSNAYGCVEQLYRLKRANRTMKVMLSIGGWNWSGNFAAAAGTAATRANFARTSVQLMKDWGFDGIDIDWEYPSDDLEASNLILLLQAVRDELDLYAQNWANGHHFPLTIAGAASPQRYGQLRLAELGGIVDYVFLMAYDYVVPSSSMAGGGATGHNANLYANPGNAMSTPFNTDTAVRAYIEAGFPAKKIVIGMPLYGRSFRGTDGMGMPYGAVGSGHWEEGVLDYKDLPEPGARNMYFDEVARASYVYDENLREIVSFDCPMAVEAKVGYLREQGLGGAMFWEASGDRVGSHSLISTSHRALGSLESTENWLDYPDSSYQNIAAGLM
ncbi:hypothetical protein S40288_09492 [Stachybotrys chartarum IBT 40288]|nr:hypothetical protein S40288_09492 [Stachybotrys chartarum IBT 40288]